MTRPLDIVVFGLSLSSSWGNGHATTWRALLRGLAAGGHRVLFLERDQPWYAAHRDLPRPDFCDFALYDDLGGLAAFRPRLRRADAVIVGSCVPEGAALIDLLIRERPARLVFYDIDTPVTLEQLAAGGSSHLLPRQLAAFDLYLSFAGGAALKTLERLGARRAEALFCAVDPDLYRPEGLVPSWDLGYLGTYSADRQPGLEALLLDPARRMPQARFVVAGAQYPEGIAWPPNVERIEHLPPAEHAAFYGRQRFTLNLTRAAMRRSGHAPSVRLFEAAACGTPVLSDRWNGLADLFPEGEAIAIADSGDDVVAALAMPEAERRRMAARARAIVLSRHTGPARAEELAVALARIPTATEVTP